MNNTLSDVNEGMQKGMHTRYWVLENFFLSPVYLSICFYPLSDIWCVHEENSEFWQQFWHQSILNIFIGDGKLSQNEFIGIMKDRLKRGFGVSSIEFSVWKWKVYLFNILFLFGAVLATAYLTKRTGVKVFLVWLSNSISGCKTRQIYGIFLEEEKRNWSHPALIMNYDIFFFRNFPI